MSKMRFMIFKRGSVKYFLNVEHIACFSFIGGETTVKLMNQTVIVVDENSSEIEKMLKELTAAEGGA